MHTPLFPQFRARFANLGHRVHQIRQQSLLQLDLLLSPWLPAGLLSQADQGPNSRERVYSVRRTFFGFLFQVLKPDCSCREVVRQILALCALHTDDSSSPATGAYCQARARLPWDILPRLRCALAARAERSRQLWKGFWVKVVDGTGISLPDTRKNQRSYPNPQNRSLAAVFHCSSWSAYSAWPAGRCSTTPEATSTNTNWACSSGSWTRSSPEISCWRTVASAPTP